MDRKRIIRHGVDTVMLVLLPLLMVEVLTGQALHEWLGTAMVLLFLAHHILNLGWYKSLPKGPYGPSRFLWTTLDLLLTADMAALTVSGVMMSGFVFGFLPIHGGMLLARRLHLFASYWGLLLMSVHLGLHWSMVLTMGRKIIRRTETSAARTWALRVLALTGAVYGVYAFIQQNLPDYLFLKTHFVFFDEQKPAVLYGAEYIAIIVLFAATGYYLNKLAQRANWKNAAWKWASALVPLAVCAAVAVTLNAGEPAAPDWTVTPNDSSTQTEAMRPSRNPAGTSPTEPAQPINDGFLLISGGTFEMGSPESEAWRGENEDLHTVSVSDFYISPYELTQKEYAALMGTNPSSFTGDELPVENISWLDAVACCNARSEAEGLPPAYTVEGSTVIWNRGAEGYRLPTEAEWEYACRAGTDTPFNTETSISPEESNYYGHYPYQIEENYFSQGNLTTKPGQYRQTTVAVDSFSPNAWGLYNMHGNVSEWVWDTYGTYDSSQTTDPTGPVSGNRKIYRGGGWNDFAKNMRSSYRATLEAETASFNLGLRLVRNAAAGPEELVRSGLANHTSETGGNILIAYFSWGGNTRGVAQEIQRQTGADIFEITLVNPYSNDYNTVLEQAQHDQNIQARPEIANLPDSIDSYDIVMIGYPNWWASIPMPIASFLEECDFSGKTILPVCSHGGGRFGQSQTAIAKLAPDAVLGEGLSIHYSGGGTLSQDVADWLDRTIDNAN